EVFGPSCLNSPMLFSRLFYVAASRLNSPRFSMAFIRLGEQACQAMWSAPAEANGYRTGLECGDLSPLSKALTCQRIPPGTRSKDPQAWAATSRRLTRR